MSYYETSATFETDSGQEVTATVRYYPGRTAVMYLRNGAPGYPAEPAEVEVFDIKMCDMSYVPTQDEWDRWETHVLENPDMYFAEFDCDWDPYVDGN